MLPWWMEKVSVATRFPFMKTPKEPESTVWPGVSFSGVAAQALRGQQGAQESRWRVIDRALTSFSFQTDPACYLRRDRIDVLAASVNAARSLQIGSPALLVKLAKLFRIP